MKMLTLILFLAFALASNGVLNQARNGYARTMLDPRTVAISVIEEKEATKLFTRFLREGNIPFDYSIDGCFARATAMARIAEKSDIQMGKVFAEGLLQAKTKLEKMPIAFWNWHVAPIVHVKKADGSIELQVFDPSIFDKPVTVDEWISKMMVPANGIIPKVEKLYYGSRFQYYPYKYENSRTEWKQHNLKHQQTTLKIHNSFLVHLSSKKATPQKTTPSKGAQ